MKKNKTLFNAILCLSGILTLGLTVMLTMALIRGNIDMNSGIVLVYLFLGIVMMILGYLLRSDWYSEKCIKNIDENNTFDELLFHKSWDWLMPVIIKISKLKISLEPTDIDYAYPRTFGMMNEEGDLMFRFNGFLLHSDKELINAANKATIEYIEWYNEQ